VTIETTTVHPWLIGLILAENDHKLVAELMHVDEAEVGRYKILHAREIAEGMYANLTAKVVGEIADRVSDLPDGLLLKLFEIMKGNLVVNQTNNQNNAQFNFATPDAVMRLADRMHITTERQE
jgi:hypothetical protein